MNAPQSAVAIPETLGTSMDGGWLAGRIRIGDRLVATILPPLAIREHPAAPWAESMDDVPAARSYCDGHANTIAMAKAGSRIAQFALDHGLFIPARDQLEPIYRIFKPAADTVNQWRSGDNTSSEPPGYPYTEEGPLQTPIADFQHGGSEAFAPELYWSSTQFRRWPDTAWAQSFAIGDQDLWTKSHAFRVAFVRSVVIR